ncbi:glycosyltransferase family 61 protein [Nocardioides currus]|uniref:Glycosyltransferase 61 catalytic domain-containing protein n=1 Tax=Nocardioides currus TaxID=2133958 RepID=A0A2R7YYH6_9ACTN|nr:glycosyltransferase 61 family protein [Nocardioides currus]PUA81401.1 hypothetical protein C7S10_10340 [Nocardioides currus]
MAATGLVSAWRRRRRERALTDVLASCPAPYVLLDRPGAVRDLDAAPGPGTVVDPTGEEPAAVLKRFVRAFWHVREGGRYVVQAGSDDDARSVHAALLLLAGGEQPDLLRVRRRLRRELARATGSVELEGSLVVVEKTGPSLLKLEEDQTGLLPLRTGTRVEVLEHRDAADFTPGRSVTNHGPNPTAPLTSMTVPATEVRRYTGDLTLHEGMVVTAGETVLPESFKWFEHRPLENSKLRDITPRFARLKDTPSPDLARLPGSYYLFEYKNSGHYGHLLTEGVAKLWGWERAKEADPSVRLAIRRHRRDRGRDIVRPDVAVLAAYGVGPDDVVWLEESVRVDTLVTATPQLHNKEPFSIDPRIVEVWDRLLAGLLADAPAAGERQRMFVTRRSGHRLCHNWRDVERVFTDAGFVVAEPARHTLPEQARLFSDAAAVAGFGGTGLFNLVFAAQAPPVVVLNHAGYDARNEELITAARGSDLHTFWSEPDHPQPEGGFDYRSFQSSWTFDLEQHGDALRALLARL